MDTEIKMHPYKGFWVRMRYDTEFIMWEVADREDRLWNIWMYKAEVYNLAQVIDHINNSDDYKYFLIYMKDDLEKKIYK